MEEELKNWREEFDRRFPYEWISWQKTDVMGKINETQVDQIKEIKSFISKLLLLHNERMSKFIEAKFNEVIGEEPRIEEVSIGGQKLPVKTGLMAVSREGIVDLRDQVLALLKK